MQNKLRSWIKARKESITWKINYYRDPRRVLASLIFWIFGKSMSNVPYPLFNYVQRHVGGWAGDSIRFAISEYRYKNNIRKLSEVSVILIAIAIISLIIIGAKMDSDSFIFGFVQNLAADIIFIIIALYLLPKVLNRQKKYDITIVQKPAITDLRPEKGKKEIQITIINKGEEVYKAHEISWDIFIPPSCFTEEDVIEYLGNYELENTGLGKMWKFSGMNEEPLFLTQQLIIASINFSISELSGTDRSPMKFYYRILTIGGNLPSLDNVTEDFQGHGIPFEHYPKVGEILFTDWYSPQNIESKEMI